MKPQRADLVLTDVPHGETQVHALHDLHVETDRWDGHRDLSSCIRPNHRDLHLGLASPITRIPDHDALVASSDVMIFLADMHC